MNAALSLADQGYPCVLLDQKKRLGGNAWRLHHTDRNEKIRPVLEQLIERVEHHDRIEVIKGARILSVDGSVGNFTSRIEIAGSTRFTTYGVAIIATGAVESRPAEYLYGHDERIMTHLKFDAAMRNSAGQIHRAASVVFIQCVGSREPKQPYCSRACCTHTMQSAISLKTLNPEMNVYVLYRDIRTYGEREILYKNSGPGRYLHSFSPRGQA
jgi:heterodisulfide reductase subunit A